MVLGSGRSPRFQRGTCGSVYASCPAFNPYRPGGRSSRRNVPSAARRASRRTIVSSKATTRTWPAIAAGTFSSRPSIAPPWVAAISTVRVRSLLVISTGPTIVGAPVGSS